MIPPPNEPAWPQAFGDLAAWQSMLERHGELFAEVRPGARIGIVPRQAAGPLPGRQAEGARVPATAAMMVWQVEDRGIAVRIEPFPGLPAPRVDLLLAPDADALAAMRDALNGDLLKVIRRRMRRGSVMFFVFRTKDQLQAAGYEDFLDSLGLACLGACR